jgi:ATP adenylyltransferase/5',5'''-P-1,P-4-tetraphosphate phosphorylase II
VFVVLVLVLEFVESTVLLTLNALFWIWKCIISQERRVYFNSCKASPVTRRIDD